eukprot:1440473-Amphidinium_carterae.1
MEADEEAKSALPWHACRKQRLAAEHMCAPARWAGDQTAYECDTSSWPEVWRAMAEPSQKVQRRRTPKWEQPGWLSCAGTGAAGALTNARPEGKWIEYEGQHRLPLQRFLGASCELLALDTACSTFGGKSRTRKPRLSS